MQVRDEWEWFALTVLDTARLLYPALSCPVPLCPVLHSTQLSIVEIKDKGENELYEYVRQENTLLPLRLSPVFLVKETARSSTIRILALHLYLQL
jgi:hypothetical protein